MTRDDIISMAREAGFQTDMFGLGIWDSSEFNKFAELVAEATREHSAKMLSEEGWLMAATLVRVKK